MMEAKRNVENASRWAGVAAMKVKKAAMAATTFAANADQLKMQLNRWKMPAKNPIRENRKIRLRYSVPHGGIPAMCAHSSYGGSQKLFNLLRRALALEEYLKHETLRPLARLAWAALSPKSPIFGQGMNLGFKSETGGQQGDPPSSLAFCLAVHPYLVDPREPPPRTPALGLVQMWRYIFVSKLQGSVGVHCVLQLATFDSL